MIRLLTPDEQKEYTCSFDSTLNNKEITRPCPRTARYLSDKVGFICSLHYAIIKANHKEHML